MASIEIKTSFQALSLQQLLWNQWPVSFNFSTKGVSFFHSILRKPVNSYFKHIIEHESIRQFESRFVYKNEHYFEIIYDNNVVESYVLARVVTVTPMTMIISMVVSCLLMLMFTSTRLNNPVDLHKRYVRMQRSLNSVFVLEFLRVFPRSARYSTSHLVALRNFQISHLISPSIP